MAFDMTRGSPGKLLLRFALPLILSSIVQQLYTLCDSVIVGRLLGENAFAAWIPVALFLFVCYRRILRQRLANQPENLQKEAHL